MFYTYSTCAYKLPDVYYPELNYASETGQSQKERLGSESSGSSTGAAESVGRAHAY
jgi:hypothetical protein